MTTNTLLIPTDGSETAEAAARRGFDLADALGASVHLLSVADSSVATGTGYSGDSASVRERLRDRASARVASLREVAADRGLEVTGGVREGIPAKEIVDCADERRVDAVVVGTAGRGGVARAIVGSVADKVVRTASVPVVTITPTAAEHEGGFDSLLLPTDGSERATVGVARGLDLADALGASVHLLSVADAAVEGGLATVSEGDDDAELAARAEQRLESATADARERGLEVVTTAATGDPAAVIVDHAEEADLIAMGTAGRGGFERAVLGSVADEVVRTATVPVLTVRSDGPIRAGD